ncbi:unnamed protein product [Rhizoctonia solani]|uniref:Uncharacterized protein n=1 Tax=Rhizoctonia solani TaxID=456999 RepID=A0A8H3B8F0_9AGAM|nr:unnamed protein product [Rhizoctonia solani]
MQSDHQAQLSANINSILDALLSTPDVSPSDAAKQITTLATDYFRTCAQPSADPTEDTNNENYGPCTPEIPIFFECLWGMVVRQAKSAPVEKPAQREHTTRLVELVCKIKGNRHPEGEEWFIHGQRCSWEDLPLLGLEIRESYNGPFDSPYFWKANAMLLSQEAQIAMAGASRFQSQGSTNGDPETLSEQVAESRHSWLSLQPFICRLWSDCHCNSYAVYAIWAIRPALEDWPETPPSFDAQHDNYERSPAYLALEVEVASIWICKTAPLMYKCTEIWGPNGNPDWNINSAPGQGGRRWDGVDGYDREHKRWQLWKAVLAEVIRWCDGPGSVHMKGWKVKDAATGAMEVMNEVERME